MARIVVFAALGWECQPALRALRGVRRATRDGVRAWQGTAGGDEVLVVKTGVGVQRAAAAAAALALADYAAVISTGCAGGLAPSLTVGELVIADAVHAGEAIHAVDAPASARALALAARIGLRARSGAIRCSPTLLTSPAAKRAAAAGGAIAVEMEGGPLAAAAAVARVPFLSVRAVLDGADDDLGVLGHISDPATGRVRPLTLAAHLLRHPESMTRLRALQRAQRASRASLDRFFNGWFCRS